MAEPGDTRAEKRPSEVEQLRAQLAAARSHIEKLTAMLREQEVAARRIEQARQGWAQTVDALAQPIFIHDENGSIVRANRAYARRAGLPVKNVVGRVYWKLFPLRDSPFPVPETGADETEFELALSPDEVFLVRSVGAAAGLPPAWRLYVFQDVTALKRAEEAVSASAQYAQSIVRSSPAMIIATDRERRIVEFNPAAELAFGFRRDEVVGKPVTLLYADPEAADGVRRMVIERKGVTTEIQNRRKNGEIFTSLLSAAVLRDPEDRMLGIVGMSLDVSERKEAEAKLRAALAELEAMFESCGAAMAYVRKRAFERINQRFAEMMGYEKKELLGRSTELVYSRREDFEKLGREAYPVLAQGAVYETTTRFKRKDGTVFWVRLIGRALQPGRANTGSIWTVEDITEQRRAEEDQRRREARLRAIIENSGAAFLVMDAGGVIRYQNPAAEQVLGYPAAERAGRPFFDLMHPEDSEAARIALQRVLHGELRATRFSLRVRHRDGAWRRFEASAVGVPDGNGGTAAVMTLLEASEGEGDDGRLLRSMEEALTAIAAAVEMRDPYSVGHQRRVSDLAVAIAREMGLDAQRVRGLRLAAAVHEIGNIHIPGEILSKPGKLTELEYEFVRTHPQAGYEILKDIDFPWPVAEIVLQHHELLDGSGYPRGLKADQILLEARILAVANVVSAMTAHRAFVPAAGIDAALAEIIRLRGVKYDPQAVDACVRLFREKNYTFDKR